MDILESDWELVPTVPRGDNLNWIYCIRGAMTELALACEHVEPAVIREAKVDQSLKCMAELAMTAYKTEDLETLKKAMVHGVAALESLIYERDSADKG